MEKEGINIKIYVYIFIILLLIFSMYVRAEDFNENFPPEKVSFEFNGVSINNVLEAIAKSVNINLMVGSDLNKKISLKLDDIQFEDAIKIITETNNLDYVYQNGVLIVDTKERIRDIFGKKKEEGGINNPEVIKSKTNILVTDNINQQSVLIVDKDYPDLKPKDPGYKIEEGINKGVLIPAKLEVGLVSSSNKCPALVRVTKSISYKGSIIIPKGSVFIGYGVSDYGVRQIFVKLDELVIGDREINVKAHLVKDDGTSGFCSEYRDLQMEKFWPTFLMNFVSSIGAAFKDVSYVYDNNGISHQIEDNTLKNDLIGKAQNGVDGWTNELMKDAKKHEAIITVNSGIEGFVFIDEKISLDKFN